MSKDNAKVTFEKMTLGRFEEKRGYLYEQGSGFPKDGDLFILAGETIGFLVETESNIVTGSPKGNAIYARVWIASSAEGEFPEDLIEMRFEEKPWDN